MAIIMALVKIKAVLIKVLLGLKAMGYEALVWRTDTLGKRKKRRRRKRSDAKDPLLAELMHHPELLASWKELQSLVNAKNFPPFDVDACIDGITKSNLKFKSIDDKFVNKDLELFNANWTLSHTLGSMLGLEEGCVLLNSSF